MEDAHLNLSSWLGRLSGNGWNPVVPMSSLMPSDWMTGNIGNMKLPHAAWQDLLWKMKSYEIWEFLDKVPSTYTVGRFFFPIFILIQVDFWGTFDDIQPSIGRVSLVCDMTCSRYGMSFFKHRLRHVPEWEEARVGFKRKTSSGGRSVWCLYMCLFWSII